MGDGLYPTKSASSVGKMSSIHTSTLKTSFNGVLPFPLRFKSSVIVNSGIFSNRRVRSVKSSSNSFFLHKEYIV
jgi:hypothetical protein